jgi:hypothetical protein
MILSEHDKASDLFRNLSAHFSELLEKAHRSNEKSLSIEETASLRGRMKLLRELLKLGSEHNQSAAISN